MTNPSEHPDCLRCKHYFVTWQSDKPRGCRAYEFKSPQWPSQVVLESSGESCQLFEPTPEARSRTRLVR